MKPEYSRCLCVKIQKAESAHHRIQTRDIWFNLFAIKARETLSQGIEVVVFLARLFKEYGELLQSLVRQCCNFGLSFACKAFSHKPQMLLL